MVGKMPKSGANMKIEFDPETPTAVQESLEVRAILGGMLIANIEGVRLIASKSLNTLQFTCTGDRTHNPLDIYRIDKLQGKLLRLLVRQFSMSNTMMVLGLW